MEKPKIAERITNLAQGVMGRLAIRGWSELPPIPEKFDNVMDYNDLPETHMLYGAKW